MKKNPKISIITVCYNSEETIEDTIRSVINQSYSNIEFIVIDGLSSDKTLDVINRYKNDISVIISEKDKGMYDAINKGIKLATGVYIGILNSDDFYVDEQVIEKVINKIETEQKDALYADLHYVDFFNTNKVVRNWKSGKYKINSFINGWMPPHPTFFITKKAYSDFGAFNTILKSAADYELMLRMLLKYKVTVTYLEEVIVKMRVGGMSNVSFKNRVKANKEDRKAWEINGLIPNELTFIKKPLRKLSQFIRK